MGWVWGLRLGEHGSRRLMRTKDVVNTKVKEVVEMEATTMNMNFREL